MRNKCAPLRQPPYIINPQPPPLTSTLPLLSQHRAAAGCRFGAHLRLLQPRLVEGVVHERARTAAVQGADARRAGGRQVLAGLPVHDLGVSARVRHQHRWVFTERQGVRERRIRERDRARGVRWGNWAVSQSETFRWQVVVNNFLEEGVLWICFGFAARFLSVECGVNREAE